MNFPRIYLIFKLKGKMSQKKLVYSVNESFYHSDQIMTKIFYSKGFFIYIVFSNFSATVLGLIMTKTVDK